LTALWDTIQTALWNVFHRPGLSDIIDILIVTVIIYFLLMMTRQTRASAVLKGLVVLLIATFVSDLLGLTALNWLLMSVVNNGAVVLVILFQPEIRKALEQLGRGAVRENSHAGEGEDQARIIDEIIQCMTDLSRRRVGALIVFEQKTGLKDVIETGTAVDARISAPLLENIFEPNTPLHDGAVVIRGTRVVAGACILTLTEGRGISRELGTRHRAAIGISETTDAIVLIVSEETGIMSMARGGRLTRHLDTKSLREILEGIYAQPHTHRLASLLGRKRGKEAAR
jgi:diadenylate cyclase